MSLSCVNCDSPLGEVAYPYLFCSQLCRQTAEHIRYSRRVMRDGRILQTDVRDALTIQRAHILAGGYDEKRRRVSDDVRDAAFARQGGKCAECGGTATDLDHIDPSFRGDINDPRNLQALCRSCHNAKTMTLVAPTKDPEVLRLARTLDKRIRAEPPERLCDDDIHWGDAWRALARERKGK